MVCAIGFAISRYEFWKESVHVICEIFMNLSFEQPPYLQKYANAVAGKGLEKVHI